MAKKPKKSKVQPSWLTELVKDLGKVEHLHMEIQLPSRMRYNIDINNVTPDEIRDIIKAQKELARR